MSDAELAALGDSYIDLLAGAYPTTATVLGLHDHDGELGSLTERSMEELASALHALRARADGIDPVALSHDARIDRELLAQAIDSALLEVEGTQWWRRNPEQAVESALVGLFFLVLREFAPPGERARSLEARLRRLPSYLREAQRTLSDTPLALVETAARSADAGAAFVAGALPAWAKDLGSEGIDLLEAAAPAAEALRAHAAWLRGEYAGRATAPVGVGAEMIARVVRTHHLLADGPDVIARKGEEILARTREEIAEVARHLGHPDWRTAAREVRKDLPAPDGLIAAYRDGMRWTERVVRERGLATTVEDAPLEVRETPPFWRHTLPYAAYSSPGPFDADQRGIFWVTPPDGDLEKLEGHPRASIPIVALHEGYPGHHLQLTRANRHPSRLRRIADSSLMAEGWAFYCEEMAHEQGLLAPESRLCQLKDQLWRACRVIVDMRLHQRRMTPEAAVEMLVGEADLERPNAEAEVRRYIYSPGYQMSYAIGKQEILDLREQVRRAEGTNFTLARFHDRLLDQGTLPVPLLARALLPSGA